MKISVSIAMRLSPDTCIGGGEDARRRAATLTLAVPARTAEARRLWVSVIRRLPRASEACGFDPRADPTKCSYPVALE